MSRSSTNVSYHPEIRRPLSSALFNWFNQERCCRDGPSAAKRREMTSITEHREAGLVWTQLTLSTSSGTEFRDRTDFPGRVLDKWRRSVDINTPADA